MQIKELPQNTPEMFPKDTQIEVSGIKDGKKFTEKVPAGKSIKTLS